MEGFAKFHHDLTSMLVSAVLVFSLHALKINTRGGLPRLSGPPRAFPRLWRIAHSWSPLGYRQEALSTEPLPFIAHSLVLGVVYGVLIVVIWRVLRAVPSSPTRSLSWREIGVGFAVGIGAALVG